MGYATRCLAAAWLGAVLAGPAHAQLTGYYPLSPDGLSLSNDDFAHLIDAANGLLRRSSLAVGSAASWRNDNTGSAGTISVTQTFRHGSMLCHRLVYATIPADTPPANHTVLDWCNAGGRAWKILPS